MRAKITALAVGVAITTAGPPAEAGAEPGLTVDPQSPAGVEYQVPLDSARRHAGGGATHHHGGASGGSDFTGGGGGSGGGSNGGGGAGGTAPTLFGSGITPPSSSASGSGASGGARASGGGSGAQADNGGGAAGAQNGTAVTRPVTATASYSTTGPIAVVIGAILLLGGGLGLLLRQHARRRTGKRIFS